MAHPYTTRARLQSIAQARRISAYADHNADSAEDTGVISGAIERACNRIDSKLGKRYSTPFDSTAGVADDGTLADIADLLTLHFLLQSIDPERAASFAAEAHALLAEILAGTAHIDAGLVTENNRRGGVRHEAGALTLAGNVDDDYTTDGVPRTPNVW